MIKIKDINAILIQHMLTGRELFAGVKKEGNFGHLLMAGLGGIFIEVLKDVSVSLAPIVEMEAEKMIKSLRSYKLIQGLRGQEGVNEKSFIEAICRLSV